jgi:uncharacterized protein YbjT (DUF2867 family)
VEIKNKTAILLGASGLIGGFCLRTLLEDSSYTKIVLLNRRTLPVAADSRIIQKAISFDSLSASDFAGADDVFSALGTTMRKAGSQEAFRRVDVDYPLAASQMARQAGASQLVLISSVGANAKSGSFYLRTKGELDREVAGLGFDAVHIFRPSLLLGARGERRLGEQIMQSMSRALNLVLVGGLRRYRAIPAESVGRAMVAAARQGSIGAFIYEYDEIVRLAA